MPVFMIALILLLSVSAGGGLALASQDALPGDTLYPVKVIAEGLQTTLLPGDEPEAQSSTGKAAKRTEEARARSGANSGSATGSITGTVTMTPTATVTPTATFTPTATVTADPDPGKGRPTVTISGTLGITLTNTISDVNGLVNDPDVPGESQNGLLAKLLAAQAAIGRGQPKVAVNNLDAFLNQLNAMQQSEHISSSNYDALYARYSEIVGALGGTPDDAPAPALLPSPESTPETGQPAVGPDRGRRPEKNAQHGNSNNNGKNGSHPEDSNDDAAPAPEASPAPNASGAKADKPAAGPVPGAGRSSAPSSPGKSGNRR